MGGTPRARKEGDLDMHDTAHSSQLMLWRVPPGDHAMGHGIGRDVRQGGTPSLWNDKVPLVSGCLVHQD
jgi:hypothetical protein